LLLETLLNSLASLFEESDQSFFGGLTRLNFFLQLIVYLCVDLLNHGEHLALRLLSLFALSLQLRMEFSDFFAKQSH